MTASAAPTLLGGVAVHCDSVVHLYSSPGGDVVALRGVDLDVEPGGVIALLGPSGSGKSTLLALLAGLLRASSGHVLVGANDLGRSSNRKLLELRSSAISLMLQDPMRNLLGFGTAEQNIEFAQREARRRRRRPPPWSPLELLDLLGMSSLAHQTVATLSGGEQQRVGIASAAAKAPQLLLLDEPTSDLDTKSRDRVIELVLEVHQQLGTTLVVVTHDPAVAAAMPPKPSTPATIATRKNTRAQYSMRVSLALLGCAVPSVFQTRDAAVECGVRCRPVAVARVLQLLPIQLDVGPGAVEIVPSLCI